MASRFATLMYHELSRVGRELCEIDRGYARYCVTERAFADHMRRLAGDGFAGLSVGRALDETADRPIVALSFDDGCATDLLVAAPVLSSLGFTATSFVTTGFLGRRGFLTKAMLKELADAGMEIGSHAVTHRFLSDLPDAELTSEVVRSRDELEQAIGRAVVHFSCPGGRFDARVTAAVRAAGYRSMATSRIGLHVRGRDPFRMPRIVVTDGATEDYVARAARGRGLLGQRMRASALDAVKATLGNRVYVMLRARAFGDARD